MKAEDVLKLLERHEEDCNRRYADIQSQLDKLDRRLWGIVWLDRCCGKHSSKGDLMGSVVNLGSGSCPVKKMAKGGVCSHEKRRQGEE